MNRPFVVFILSIILSICAEAKNLQVPLSLFGSAQNLQGTLPDPFQVLVWNVHKGSDKNLIPDFASLSRFSNLVLFQEAIDEDSWSKKISRENQNMAWSLARSFETSGHYTGVATAADVLTLKRMGYRTENTEPVTQTPKTMLLSEYSLSDGRTLRVLNVHGINFVLNELFYSQVDQIVTLLKDHKGPLLVAGDFNTWNEGRTHYLVSSLGKLGLEHVELEKHGLLELDHVFVRGLRVLRKSVNKEIESSDHKPILIELTHPAH